MQISSDLQNLIKFGCFRLFPKTCKKPMLLVMVHLPKIHRLTSTHLMKLGIGDSAALSKPLALASCLFSELWPAPRGSSSILHGLNNQTQGIRMGLSLVGWRHPLILGISKQRSTKTRWMVANIDKLSQFHRISPPMRLFLGRFATVTACHSTTTELQLPTSPQEKQPG